MAYGQNASRCDPLIMFIQMLGEYNDKESETYVTLKTLCTSKNLCRLTGSKTQAGVWSFGACDCVCVSGVWGCLRVVRGVCGVCVIACSRCDVSLLKIISNQIQDE